MSSQISKSDRYHILGLLYSEGTKETYAQVPIQYILSELRKDGIKGKDPESLLRGLRNQGLIRLHEDWAQLTDQGMTEYQRLHPRFLGRDVSPNKRVDTIRVWIGPITRLIQTVLNELMGHH
ncbi:hypothetical protein EDB95_0386 [Dinghuibacter silviterrae]|uniref:PadR family transcriptional regulator n=1 Tax=Dinghuibacter silviterrae TaxID=1539049 RepID=A0A4R8DQ00_9BACT|nr:hypothetical protein EDB95_0386 [Dinghuibacter silviterrae]